MHHARQTNHQGKGSALAREAQDRPDTAEHGPDSACTRMALEAKGTEKMRSRPTTSMIAFIPALIMLVWWPYLALAAPADQYRAQIIREAQFRFGVPAPAPVIAGQVQQESAWNPAARSRVGAAGLMQFMPATSQWAATAGAFGSVDPYNPVWSIRAGVWYDRWLYDRIKADTECDRWMFTLASYNGGLGRVYKRQSMSIYPGQWSATGYINPGISAGSQHENQSYGPRIMQRHQPAFKAWGKTLCLKD